MFCVIGPHSHLAKKKPPEVGRLSYSFSLANSQASSPKEAKKEICVACDEIHFFKPYFEIEYIISIELNDKTSTTLDEWAKKQTCLVDGRTFLGALSRLIKRNLLASRKIFWYIQATPPL
ncbi:hypothetical protein [Pseudoalteromonas galatheae]|uniref:hypothetical protein n=1 Tax=Pseudoalteromonas galatheae TaxID=579562 RepID=UPI0030CB0795